jgi:nucleoid-associated protein YgaU
MSLVLASIEVLTGRKKSLVLPVLFNPSQYSLDRSNSFKSTPIPGLGSPLIQFVNGDAATLTMDLFLDDYTDEAVPGRTPANPAGPAKSVVRRMEAITSLLDIDSSLHAPPTVRFAWGPLRFTAVLEKVSRKVTLFRPNGAPARATLSVTFREYRTLAQQLSRTRRESADKSKRRQLTAAESIWLIAEREYGDVRAWRAIAAASEVDDPRALRPGDWLRVPPWEGPDVLRKTL